MIACDQNVNEYPKVNAATTAWNSVTSSRLATLYKQTQASAANTAVNPWTREAMDPKGTQVARCDNQLYTG